MLNFSPAAIAQVEDLQPTFVKTPRMRATPAELITISQLKIEGPDFSRTLKGDQPAGTGHWVYDASCTINGKSVCGEMPMGASMNADP